ncbi:MAG: cytochrome c [Trueperaceae bacterium]|nr:MAG: cytochrome c [Trueperaceae bacterium]
MPEPTRQYIFTTEQVRLMFIGLTTLAILVLTLILLMISFRPQGRLITVDQQQFQTTIAHATELLDGYEQLEDGRVRIDIRRAMELVAERGVSAPFTEDPQADTSEPSVETTAAVDGETVYANCLACHQAEGQGLPGVFPPLAGHAPSLYRADRDQLPLTILYGLQGTIEVSGQSYTGLMPQWPQLSDEEIAAVLNYILNAWGNDQLLPDDYSPYRAEELAALRGLDLGMMDVLEKRQALNLP